MVCERIYCFCAREFFFFVLLQGTVVRLSSNRVLRVSGVCTVERSKEGDVENKITMRPVKGVWSLS